MSLNKFIGMGRLVANPERKVLPSDSSVTKFCIAVDRDFKNKNGEREADFINCVSWNKTADYVDKYFSKGKMAVVEGRLQVRNWTDEEGKKHYITEVVVDKIYFGESKKAQQESSESFGNEYKEQQFTELSDDGDTLPF